MARFAARDISTGRMPLTSITVSSDCDTIPPLVTLLGELLCSGFTSLIEMDGDGDMSIICYAPLDTVQSFISEVEDVLTSLVLSEIN